MQVKLGNVFENYTLHKHRKVYTDWLKNARLTEIHPKMLNGMFYVKMKSAAKSWICIRSRWNLMWWYIILSGTYVLNFKRMDNKLTEIWIFENLTMMKDRDFPNFPKKNHRCRHWTGSHPEFNGDFSGPRHSFGKKSHWNLIIIFCIKLLTDK